MIDSKVEQDGSGCLGRPIKRPRPGSRSGLSALAQVWGVPFVCLTMALAWPVCGQETPAGMDPSPGPLRIQAGTEVVAQWQPHQHLYVKGDVGVGPEQLDQLEAWLDQRAANWTIVLLESGQGEQFIDAEGRRYSDLDAVEHGLGKGLPNRTGFGQLTDLRTGERNGAFFVLFLKDRKFSYFASDAMDRHGLGEDRWQGNLDRPAIAAMRSGGRIVDAVKDTVTQIEQRLTQRLEAEKAQIQRREAAAQAEREQQEANARIELQRATEQARAGIQATIESVGRLEQSLGGLQRVHPEMTGDIARPDIPRMQADLAAAKAALEGGNPAASIALSGNVTVRADKAAMAIADHREAGPQLALLGARIDQIPTRPYAQAAAEEIDHARDAFERAQQAYTRGDSTYAAMMDELRAAGQAAEVRIETAARAAQRRRVFLASIGGLGLMGLLALGLGLNLRRRPSRREALSLVEVWSKGLGDKTVALFELLDRTHGMLGGSAEEAAGRHTGRTLEIGRQIIKDVDEMMIMSACASQVLASAKALALPQGLGGRLANQFTVRHYQAAVRRLRDEPIVFRPEDGLEFVVRGPRTERETLLGPVESYQPFTMTFQELIEAFNQRAARALAAIQKVETSVYTVGELLETTLHHIREAGTLEQDLRAAGADTGFGAAPVFSELLPAARQEHAEAVKLVVRDPVGVVETSAVTARQKADDALAIARIAMEFHQTARPRLDAAKKALDAVPLDTRWLAASADGLSGRADEIASRAITGSAAAAIAALAGEIQALADRADRVVALDQARRDVAMRSIEDTEELIRATRDELGAAVGLPAGRILREPQDDPTGCVDQAHEQAVGVKAALERGDVEAGQQGLDGVARLTEEATAIVKSTREAFTAHATTLAACRQETGRLTGRIPELERVLADIRRDYAPSVLLLGEGDPTHPRANDTIQDNLDEVLDHLAEIRSLADRAEARHCAAAFLDAARCLYQAAARQEQVRFRMEEIEEKRKRLESAEASNARLRGDLEGRVAGWEAEVNDPRTIESTARAFNEACRRLDRAIGLMHSMSKDPFAVAMEMEAVGQTFALVHDQVLRDREAHAEAERRIAATAEQLEGMRRLAHQARTDSVADSTTLVQIYRDGDALTERMERVRSLLTLPHGNWTEVRGEADGILSEAGRLTSILRGEVEAGQNAIAAIHAATGSVARMNGWRGGFGVSILGSPGARALEQAMALLAAGSYIEALRAGESARRAAEAAMAEAEAEQRRRDLAEQERLQRERRQREAEERRRRDAWSPSILGHSGLGHSGLGHSGFSSHSGASHSSFSSHSGTSRSGW